MNDKELSIEIKKGLNSNISHINPICNLIKHNFIENCKYSINTKITLEHIYTNTDCIKIYNRYYDCYKNDKQIKILNEKIQILNEKIQK